MAIVPVDGPEDPRVEAYRDLSDRDRRARHGQFVAEGRLVVQRTLEDGRFVVRSLLVSDASRRSLGASLDRLDPAVPVYVCETVDFASITGYNLHRGCLALVDRPAPVVLADLCSTARTLVVLEALADPDNVGGAFRNAAAFGVDGVLLSPTCGDPLYRKAVRTSMGAVLSVPFVRVDDWTSGLSAVRGAGFALVALTPREPARTLAEFASQRPRPAKIALMVGTEGAGLSELAERTADHRVRIPIRPVVDSLNVAVALGIALHCITAQ